MFRQKLTGIAAAATLGSAAILGAGVASAAIMIDETAAAMNTVTYAKETITADVDDHDGYYIVGMNTTADSLNVVGKVGTGIAGSTRLLLTFKMDGMIFTADSLDANAETALTLASAEGNTLDQSQTLTYRRSVEAGDSEVAFVVTVD